jgi:hypothetical protein
MQLLLNVVMLNVVMLGVLAPMLAIEERRPLVFFESDKNLFLTADQNLDNFRLSV